MASGLGNELERLPKGSGRGPVGGRFEPVWEGFTAPEGHFGRSGKGKSGHLFPP